MDDELKQKLVDYLDTLESGIETGGDFVAEQAPLVVQEFLAWEFWSCSLRGALFGAVLLAGVLCMRYVRRWYREFNAREAKGENIESDEYGLFALSFVGAISVVGIGLFGIFLNGYWLVKVTVAPRLVVLEEIARLLP